MEGAWKMMLNNPSLGLDRAGRTLQGTFTRYNDEHLREWDYSGRMAKAYVMAAVDRPNTEPDTIGAKSVYHQRGSNGRWTLVSEGFDVAPSIPVSPSEMRSEHPERNPARIRELEDTRQLRLHIRDLRDDFHPDDPNRNRDVKIKLSPKVAEADLPAEERQLAFAQLAQTRGFDLPAHNGDASPTLASATAGPLRLDDPAHPNAAMMGTLVNVVYARDDQLGRSRDQLSIDLAAALVEKARERDLPTIGFALFTPDGSKVAITDTQDPNSPWARTAVGQVGDLVGRPLDASSENVARINQQRGLDQLAPAQTLAQAQLNPDESVRKSPTVS
jgi:hypothetical protein